MITHRMHLVGAAFQGGRIFRKRCEHGHVQLREIEGKDDGDERAGRRGPVGRAEKESISGFSRGIMRRDSPS